MKNHVNGLGYGDGRIIATPHGFTLDTKEAVDQYKKDYSQYWVDTLGAADFDLTEQTSSKNLEPDYED